MAAFDFKTATPASASASALIFGAESQLAATPSIYNTTGSGTVVLNTSATLVTPTIGVATATSINKVAITAPASSATLTIANGKTFTCSNTLTFTGTDSSSVAFGAGGTVLYSGGALGTPSSGTLTNCSGLPISGIASLGTGVGTALAVNVGSAGAFVTFNGALGTPSSGTLTNATGLPISTGVSGLGTGNATALAVNVGSAGAFVRNNAAETISGALTLTSAAPQLTLGVNATTLGQMKLFGSTSGDVTIKAAAVAGTATNFTLPATNGTSGYVLQTDGSGNTSWVAGGGGGTPGGSNTQVQFNDGGAFGGDAGFTYSKTNKAVALGGLSASANTPAFTISQTWNNGAVTFDTAVMNITNTASTGASRFWTFNVDSSERLTIGRGNVGAGMNSADSYIKGPGGSGIGFSNTNDSVLLFAGNYSQFSVSGNGNTNISAINLGVSAAYSPAWNAGLTSPAANTIQLGQADAAAPAAQVLQAQSVVAGTSNTAGADFTIAGSKGTGTGAGGSIIFKTAPAGSTGTSQNAASNAWAIDSNRTLYPAASLATNMTAGFINIPGAAGAASGTPANTTGFPMYYDSTNNKIYVYNGSWRSTAALT